jgi:hypothetical protein
VPACFLLLLLLLLQFYAALKHPNLQHPLCISAA